MCIGVATKLCNHSGKNLNYMIYEFNSIKPCVDPSSFIHPQANVTGHVIIEKMST